MGDTCCYSFSMGRIQKLIEENTGAYVHSLMIGDSIEADELNGFFMNINEQVDFACAAVRADPKLKNGFNAVGFSQGGLFMRAYVERCNDPPVKNLISIGGPHQGVYGFPHCMGATWTVCEYIRELLDYGVYTSFVQDNLVQAEYWQDPLYPDYYLKNNIFLPDINNALPVKNDTYKQHMLELNNLVLVMFTEDEMVQPKESEQFGFYVPGQDKQVLTMRDTPLYKEDWLGLQVLDQSQRLHLLEVAGDHLQFTDTWFVRSIVGPFLNSTTTKSGKY
jgi:palmitoyl-protein thioesterase